MSGVNALGEASGVKAQNAEWLTPDIVPTKNAKFRVTLSLSASVVIQVTLNSGGDWSALNSNETIVANSMFIFDVTVRVGDEFNVRIPTAGGATIVICRIDEISDEG